MNIKMNNIEIFECVIEYIEEHLDEVIDVSVLAGILGVSVYEFRRIFSFIAGVPLSEYIRKRRLSVAAYELVTKGKRVDGL